MAVCKEAAISFLESHGTLTFYTQILFLLVP